MGAPSDVPTKEGHLGLSKSLCSAESWTKSVLKASFQVISGCFWQLLGSSAAVEMSLLFVTPARCQQQELRASEAEVADSAVPASARRAPRRVRSLFESVFGSSRMRSMRALQQPGESLLALGEGFKGWRSSGRPFHQTWMVLPLAYGLGAGGSSSSD